MNPASVAGAIDISITDTEDLLTFTAPRAGTLQNLRGNMHQSLAEGQVVQAEIYVDNNPTGLTLTWGAPGSTPFFFWASGTPGIFVTSFPVSAGQRIALRVFPTTVDTLPLIPSGAIFSAGVEII